MKKGGNLAAASDIARLFFIKKGFIYSDFDTKIELGILPEVYVIGNKAGGFLLPLYQNNINIKTAPFPLGNDIIACVTEPAVLQETILEIGRGVVNNYKNPMKILSAIQNVQFFSGFLSIKK